MPFYLYSAEDFPARRKANRGFQNTPEYIVFNSFTILGVKAHAWIKLERKYVRTEYQDHYDKRGQRNIVLEDEMAEAVNAQFHNPEWPNFERGVEVVDESVYNDPDQRKAVESRCDQQNREFRLRAIAEYESQLQERLVTGKGRAFPTPYEEECYEICDVVRPNSAKAIQAQRQPGLQVAQDILQALRESQTTQASLVRNPSPEEAAAINASLEREGQDESTTSTVVLGSTKGAFSAEV